MSVIDKVKTITLKSGEQVLLDKEDHTWAKKHTWYKTGKGYPAMRLKNKFIKIHRLIMDAPEGMVVDHINGNTYDNRKCNLRICTQAENTRNKKPAKNGTSKYLGVSKAGKKWRAIISINGKNKHLGCFKYEEDAAEAYNNAALGFNLIYANLNVIVPHFDNTPKEMSLFESPESI